MRNTERLTAWIYSWNSTTAEGLGLMRIFTSLFLLFFLLPGEGVQHFAWLASLPDDFYSPAPGPMRLFGSFPSLVFFQTIHTIAVLAVAAMLIGYRTKFTSVIAGLAILILQGLIYSVGKVNHEILIAMVPVVMAFSNWGLRYSVDAALKRNERIKAESWPLLLMAVIIGFMMFTAGFPKILGGWLDPTTQATYGHLLNQFIEKERDAFLAGAAVHWSSPLFWELLDWGTVLFEAGFIIAVYRLSWFRVFLCIAVLFHFSTMMLLNIAFLPNFLAYALFLNWRGIHDSLTGFWRKLNRRAGSRAGTQAVLFFSGFTMVLFALLRWAGNRDLVLADSELTLHEAVLLFAALVVVIIAGIRRLWFRSEKAPKSAME
jgi:hypothetical protein